MNNGLGAGKSPGFRGNVGPLNRWNVSTLALILVTVVALVIRIMYAATNPVLDDAFITFRYVRNLARGAGFVYNPGEHVLGTTTPMFTLILTPFAAMGADIVTTARIITILASTACVVMVFLIARRLVGEWAALLGAMLLAISTNNVWAASTGLETELNVLFLLALLFAYLERRYSVAAVLAAIALVTRPDDLILIGTMGAYHVLRFWGGRRPTSHPAALLEERGAASPFAFRERGRGVRFATESTDSPQAEHHLQFGLVDRGEGFKFPTLPVVLFVLFLAPWLVFATFYFGSPIPSSVVGKAASYREPILDNLAMYAHQYGFLPSNVRELAATLLFILGVAYVLRRRDEFITLPAYFAAYSAAFILLGARLGSGWYWQPLWPVYSVLVAGGIGLLGEALASFRPGSRLATLAKPLAAAGLVVFVLIWGAALKSRFFDPRPPDDLEWAELAMAGEWINQNTAPSATVGLETFGAVGWFSDRVIVDEGGLISPEVARINDRSGRPDYATVLRTFQPDYYLAWIHGELDIIDSVPAQKEWLAAHYQPIGSFDVGIGRAPYFILFRKTAD